MRDNVENMTEPDRSQMKTQYDAEMMLFARQVNMASILITFITYCFCITTWVT